ncbi:MAG: Txe/YoeB family addiction module toxin [Prolixibacteraceae bacterium]|jgi:toxin YoeB|nr:Txe/YoeB family addiction module toxin [Prolixibacteraceae bacterium]MBT6763110.1 Txe/YoeB family addiction module toxin [Prolixibacteraceae bacterium]MBT6997197.1 Txe/YoeB family addiction module toxin [Prolixibacteraceae bacterium]MBT7393744.1 Txe/YoeB family addiction module toxin [Prolixibacteraceae bacterium]
MRKLWENSAWNDYLYWQKTDKKVHHKINELIKSCDRTPFSGIGKPEPLKGNLFGYWSRRINKEHRLIYKVKNEIITIIQCRFHY